MNKNQASDQGNPKSFVRSLVVIALAAILVGIVGWWLKSRGSTASGVNVLTSSNTTINAASANVSSHSVLHRPKASAVSKEEEVSARLVQYTKNRRAITARYAEKLGFTIPLDMEKFFDATEAGNFDEMQRLAKLLRTGVPGQTNAERDALARLAPIVKEMMGVHEQARTWPAEALLDYGNEVLGSLKPGMVYLGGTDPGRFIPTLLNETGQGEPRIVLTQNAFADNSYLQYIDFLYGDRLTSLSPEDSQKSFQDYLADVQKRSVHDQQFPNEPKQLRPGENYNQENGRVSVSGTPAVMSINEKLLQALLKNNPNLSFALEESFPLPSTYQGATPIGPLIALDSNHSEPPLTSERATAAMSFWSETAEKILSNPDTNHPEVGDAYGRMLVGQGNLFASQNLTSQAEQAYRLAQQLSPTDVGAVHQLAELLTRTGRSAEGKQILDAFNLAHPK